MSQAEFEKFKELFSRKFPDYFTWSDAYQLDDKKLFKLLEKYGSSQEFPAPEELIGIIRFDEQEEDSKYRSGFDGEYYLHVLTALERAIRDAMNGWRFHFQVSHEDVEIAQEEVIQPGRKPDENVASRREIVRTMMNSTTDFQDPDKIKKLFGVLDKNKIRLPEWRGSPTT